MLWTPPDASHRAAEPGPTHAAWRRVLVWAGLLLVAVASGAQEEFRPLRTGGLSAEAAALLISGQEGGSIPLFALTLPGTAEGDAKAA